MEVQTLRVMVLIKATEDSEAGVMPSTEQEERLREELAGG